MKTMTMPANETRDDELRLSRSALGTFLPFDHRLARRVRCWLQIAEPRNPDAVEGKRFHSCTVEYAADRVGRQPLFFNHLKNSAYE
jgi:hypothetical protein